MKKQILIGSVILSVLLKLVAFAAQDKDTVKVPGGLALSEFRDMKTGRWSLPVTPTLKSDQSDLS